MFLQDTQTLLAVYTSKDCTVYSRVSRGFVAVRFYSYQFSTPTVYSPVLGDGLNRFK